MVKISLALVASIAGILMAPLSHAVDINVFVTGAASRAYNALIPQFERASGHKLLNQFAQPPDLVKKMDAGEPLDVIILSYDVEGLVKQGRLVVNSRTVFGRSGVGEQVRPKIRTGGSGESARLLSRGEVDFAVSGLPPFIGTPNIEWLGYLPAEIQSWVVFSGGININARQPEAGRALLNFLTTPAAVAVFTENGIDPVTP